MKKVLIVALACMLAFGGGLATWAWFTSSATSTDNTFTAGTLKVNESGVSVTETGTVDIQNLQPGDQTKLEFDVINDGTLEFKYRFRLGELEGGLVGGENPLLVSVDGEDWGQISTEYFEDDGYTLAKGKRSIKKLYVKMPKLAGNEYQGETASFKIIIEATQNVEGATFPNEKPDPEPNIPNVVVENLSVETVLKGGLFPILLIDGTAIIEENGNFVPGSGDILIYRDATGAFYDKSRIKDDGSFTIRFNADWEGEYAVFEFNGGTVKAMIQ
ncbi:TasA family protein [Proteinivorax hydrogeniformans]|uniref:TasA family protein n=1 Tax=Proteinivorax hydrogeniformans TaxID=1826727 RepID=A0AAU8HQM3_9FIRM